MQTKNCFKDSRLAFTICLIAFLVWIYLLSYKYFHLGYYDWDLAFFTQACWQLLHGTQFVPLVGINYFGDHSYFITFLILPLFALFPHPLTLVVLKLIAYLISAYLLYKIATETLGQKVALTLMVLYIIFPANIFSMLYEFNPEAFAPPILLWMFMAFEKHRWKSFFVAAILLMLIKENMALVVCAFGIYAFFCKNCPRKIAGGILLLGAVVFYILTICIIPYFRHLPYHPFVVRYEYLGHSVVGILLHLMIRPAIVATAIFNHVNALYIRDLFGALLVPALIGYHRLFFMIPILLQHLLSTHYPEHTIYYFYGATIVPFIFLATVDALDHCYQRFNRTVCRGILILLVLVSVWDWRHYTQQFALRLDYHADHLDALRWTFVNTVPAQAGVIVTFDYLAPLSLRKDLYSFHKIYGDDYQNLQKMEWSELNTNKPFTLPSQVHYALIDFRDPYIQKSLRLKSQVTMRRIKAFLNSSHWKVLKHYGSIILLER